MPKIQAALRTLPENPNLENLKKQARTLLRQVKSRLPEAQERARRHCRRSRIGVDLDAQRFSLSEAQLVIAREYGFDSWPKLRTHVEQIVVGATAPPHDDVALQVMPAVVLPLIALREQVLCPFAEVALNVAGKTLRAVNAAGTASGRAFCVTQRDAGMIDVRREDFHDVGAIARVEPLKKLADDRAIVSLSWLRSARFLRLIAGDDYDSAELAPLAEYDLSSLDTNDAIEKIYQRLAQIARGTAWLSKPELSELRQMRDLPRLITVASERCPLPVRQALLELSDPRNVIDSLCKALDSLVRMQHPEPVGSAIEAESAAARAETSACITVLYAFRHPHLLGQRYPLTEEVTRIGRGSNNHIMLHSDTISREHARLERDGGKFVLVDQKSTNGTFVNDLPEPIHRHVLGDGDRLALGDTIVCFLSGDDLEAKYRAAIDHISQHDALTGVYNRHNWLAETERQVLYARGDDRPLCAVMLHIDQLESLKQKLSSLAVNAALLRVAQVLRRTLNDRAIMGRYSNDRFCLALPGFDSNRAMDSAERLRAELCSRPLTLAGETLELTVSVGVATLYRTTGTEELVEDCVAALERASRAGGNTVRGPRETAV